MDSQTWGGDDSRWPCADKIFSMVDHQSRLEMRSTTFSETMSKSKSLPSSALGESNDNRSILAKINE
jgi:hypothetical protein